MQFTHKNSPSSSDIEKVEVLDKEKPKIRITIDYFLSQVIENFYHKYYSFNDIDFSFTVSDQKIDLEMTCGDNWTSYKPKNRESIKTKLDCSSITRLKKELMEDRKMLLMKWRISIIRYNIISCYSKDNLERGHCIKIVDDFCIKEKLSIEVLEHTVLLWDMMRAHQMKQPTTDLLRKSILGCLYYSSIYLGIKLWSYENFVKKWQFNSVRELLDILSDVEELCNLFRSLPVASEFLKYLADIHEDQAASELSLIFCRRILYVPNLKDYSTFTVATACYLGAMIDLRRIQNWTCMHTDWIGEFDVDEIRELLCSLHILYKNNKDYSSVPKLENKNDESDSSNQ